MRATSIIMLFSMLATAASVRAQQASDWLSGLWQASDAGSSQPVYVSFTFSETDPPATSAPAAPSPDLSRASFHTMLKRVWVGDDCWRLSVDSQSSSSGSAEDSDRAVGKSAQWTRHGTSLSKLPSRVIAPPTRGFATIGAQERRWARAFVSGGLSFLDDITLTDKPQVLSDATGIWNAKARGLLNATGCTVLLTGEWDGATKLGQITRIACTYESMDKPFRTVQLSRWSVESEVGANVPHLIVFSSKIVMASGELLEIRRPTPQQVAEVCEPPNKNIDAVRGTVSIVSVEDLTGASPAMFEQDGLGESRAIEHPLVTTERVRLIGWYATGALAVAVCSFLYYRWNKNRGGR